VDWLSKLLPAIKNEIHLERQEVEAGEWSRKRRQLNREGSKYVRFTMVDGNYVLLTNQQNGGQPIMHKARAIILYRIIDATAFARRPISASRNWGIPKDSANRQDSNWAPLDTARHNFDDCVDILRANGATPIVKIRTIPGNSFHTAVFTLPNTEDIMPILWKLGVWNREKGEVRTRGRPASDAS
jgi:hypothetical protein